MLVLTVEINRPGADAQAVKESLAMELERFGDARVVSIVEEMPKQATLFGADNRSEGPRPKPTLPRGRETHSSEALEYIAKRRARLNRWAATKVAEVAHPERGSVIVPYNSNLDAIECAAEYWGCAATDISGAEVRLAKPGAVPVAMPF